MTTCPQCGAWATQDTAWRRNTGTVRKMTCGNEHTFEVVVSKPKVTYTRGKAINPVARAIMRQKWRTATLDAHLQALAGGEWRTVVDRVAELMFIVGYAAHQDGLECTDLKIVHGATRTLCDVVLAQSLTDVQRATLDSGIRAVGRVQPRLSDMAMISASVHISLLMKTNGVYWGDFEKWM